MLLLLSSCFWCREEGECCLCLGLELRVSTDANLESPESLIRDRESVGEDSDWDTGLLSNSAKLLPCGVLQSWVHEGSIDLVSDVPLQAAHDVPIREAFGSTSGEVRFGAWLFVPVTQQYYPV